MENLLKGIKIPKETHPRLLWLLVQLGKLCYLDFHDLHRSESILVELVVGQPYFMFQFG